MTKLPIPISPLAFTRAYNTYRAEAADIPFADSRLLAAARFWTPVADSLTDPLLSSFIEEDWPSLPAPANPDEFEDLNAAEIEEIARFLDMAASHRLKSREGESPAEPPVAILPGSALALRSALLWQAAARKHLYVGDADSALIALRHAGLIDTTRTPSSAIPELPESANATDLPSLLAEWAEANHPMAARWFRDFDSDWTAKRESGEINRAHCLVVEYDPSGDPVRGRLRTLEGTVEQIKRADAADEVTVHHQVRAPDDPHFGAIYNALAALRAAVGVRQNLPLLYRRLHAGTGEGRGEEAFDLSNPGPRFHARLTLGPSTGESHTGDSIGLAAFALAYANWWASDIHRERRLIGSGVAFTGGIAADGSITAVSPATLRAKIARAFHSPITHLALPESNRREAETVLARLRTQNPRRRLHLIGIESTRDLITDHNILRTEKVCLGEFAARKAARWGRSVKVQVVVLVVLAYMLVSMIYPQAWLGFDWKPVSIRVTGRQVAGLNLDGKSTGVFGGFTRALDESVYSNLRDPNLGRTNLIADLNHDGLPEVVFCPFYDDPTSQTRTVHVFDNRMRPLFEVPISVRTGYKGDSAHGGDMTYGYTLKDLDIVRLRDSTTALLLISASSLPARGQAVLYDSQGHLIGFYLNQGHLTAEASGQIDFDGDGVNELYLGGTNNRLQSGSLAIVDPMRMSGVSPPWDHEYFLTSGMQMGTQRYYFTFPPTELARASHVGYNILGSVAWDPNRGLRVLSRENADACIDYQLDTLLNPVIANPGEGFSIARWNTFSHLPEADYANRLVDGIRVWHDTTRILPRTMK